MEKRAVGKLGEQYATDHLIRIGTSILARNWHTAFGELDIIAQQHNTLLFVEVKTLVAQKKTVQSYYDLFAKIHTQKLHTMRKLASSWLSQNKKPYDSARFDAIGVLITAEKNLLSLTHLENIC